MVRTSCRESGPVLLSSFPYGGGSQFGSRIAERGISSAWLERLHRTQEAIGSNPIFSTVMCEIEDRRKPIIKFSTMMCEIEDRRKPIIKFSTRGVSSFRFRISEFPRRSLTCCNKRNCKLVKKTRIEGRPSRYPRGFGQAASESTSPRCPPEGAGHEGKRKRRMVDALAHGGDEGRDKLRKSAVRGKYPLTRGHPNGTTRQAEGLPSPR